MTRTSKFVDLRLAVIQSSKGIYGNGQATAAAALDQVGIAAPGTGQTVPTNESEETIEVNPRSVFNSI